MSSQPQVTAINVASPVPSNTADDTASDAAQSSATGTEAGAALLARSFLAVQTGIDSRRSSVSSDLAPPSPASRARASSRATSSVDAQSERNLAELSDMMQELHRNQLWFTYVFASTREGFESGALAAADGVARSTLDELALALEVARDTKKRMIDIQRRTDAVKNTVAGWRNKQAAEAQAAAAVKEARAAAAAQPAAVQ